MNEISIRCSQVYKWYFTTGILNINVFDFDCMLLIAEIIISDTLLLRR